MTQEMRSALHVTVEDVEYELVAESFTAEDDLAIYRAVGASLLDIFGGNITLYTIAALLWRHRVRNGEPTLTLEQVLPTVTILQLQTVKPGGSRNTGPKARARRS